jgi:hypothetical protein
VWPNGKCRVADEDEEEDEEKRIDVVGWLVGGMY